MNQLFDDLDDYRLNSDDDRLLNSLFAPLMQSPNEFYYNRILTYLESNDYESLSKMAARMVGSHIESLAETHVSDDEENSVPTVIEYIDRISAYRPYRTNAGDYTNVCELIAEELISQPSDHNESDRVYTDRDDLVKWILDINTIEPDLLKIVVRAADEVTEYRELQRIRPLLRRSELVEHLQQALVKKVSSDAAFYSQSILENLKAELSLCLTNSERKSYLVVEYRSRLAVYKEKAKVSAVAESQFDGTLAWQCFTTKYLNGACSDFVSTHVNNYLNDVEFDFSLCQRCYIGSSKVVLETSKLTAEWLVVDWIFFQLTGESIDNNTLPTSTKEEGPTVMPLEYILSQPEHALYWLYLHISNEKPDFLNHPKGVISAIEEVVGGNSTKNFQIHYNVFKSFDKRTDRANAVRIQRILPHLEKYPLAYRKATDELKVAKNK